MKRRTALKGIVLFSLGTGIIYSCADRYEAIRNLGLKYFTPKDKELDLLDSMVKSIVPFHKISGLENHTSLPLLFTMLDDVYKEKDRNDFMFGYQNIGTFIEQEYGKSFNRLDEEQQKVLIGRLNDGDQKLDEKYLAFYSILKNESLRYFRSSEYYQRKVNYYEMAPGRFNGDVLISELKNRNEI